MTPDAPKNENGRIQMIRIGKSIRHKWVNIYPSFASVSLYLLSEIKIKNMVTMLQHLTNNITFSLKESFVTFSYHFACK